MPFKLNSPGCNCCNPCTGWTGTPPSTLQLTIPAQCEKAGAYTLANGVAPFLSDCFAQPHPIVTLCETWGLSQPTWGDEGVGLLIRVGLDASGNTIIMAGKCGDIPDGAFSTNAGHIWEIVNPAITDWSQLDGLSVPHVAGLNSAFPPPATDVNCTTPVDDALIDVPP